MTFRFGLCDPQAIFFIQNLNYPRSKFPFGNVNSINDQILIKGGKGDFNRNTVEINGNTPSAKYYVTDTLRKIGSPPSSQICRRRNKP